ncbi:MAG: PIN domain-containing protein [Synergistaceae bacterium]|nr:PIN domain-containing protein [Synergistaceae bacterium]
MRKYFVDSNVFLRFYSKDDAEQRKKAREVLLKAKKKEIDLYCGPPVFFEVAWVLASTYGLPRGEILDTLEAMLYTPNLRVLDADTVRDAIELARAAQQSFADSYIAVVARKLEAGVVSFNKKHFDKLGANLYPIENSGS